MTVVQRHYLDWRNKMWGKWRPCAEARRLGTTGVLFDTLVNREGLSHDEAIQAMCSNHGIIGDSELVAVAARLPRRIA